MWGYLLNALYAQASVLNIQNYDSFHTTKSEYSIKHSIKTVKGVHGETDWNVFSHQEFPGYALRIKDNVTLCDPTVKQYSGYLDTADDRHFYFWFFESRSNPSTDPVLMWLNGGPGCSSFIGLLMELGPCRVHKGGNGTFPNPYSWNSNANIFFLDEPVNVGFSYSDTQRIGTTEDAAKDVYTFLQLFFDAFPKYSKLDFHVSGESYAGHYIPAIGKEINDNNNAILKGGKKGLHINLKSLAIGNGITDALTQYKYYPDMAEDTKYGPILTPEVHKKMRNGWPVCKLLINACYHWQSPYTCVPASKFCEDLMFDDFSKAGLNVYDIRLPVGDTTFDDMENDIAIWLNNPEIQKQLGVDRLHQGCNDAVGDDFHKNGDKMWPIVHGIPQLLEEGIQILIYAGDADWTCNWIGNKAWTLDLPWSGQEAFQNAEDVLWVSNITKRPAGEVRTAGNFTFMRVYESSHFVPLDQPEHSLEFINKWINNKPLV
ncbi:Alpha/Beta hydrolase protein [Globomyces pollinis-pini]|nr:Alpha/Beta hydrolase protein [Globomyces pollinis-pini]KAJ2994870.1 hypothetical protein HDV02_001282 [Globomyces sp. JEL0801]